jgi:hypothetical protein
MAGADATWLIVTIIAGVLGAVALLLGLRGRKLPTPPRCAACRFDLSGLENPARCPECGASLAAPRAILTTVRRARRGPIVLASALLLIALLTGSAHVARTVYRLDWINFAPTSFLLSELNSPAPERACAELARRAGTKALSPADRSRFRAALLTRLEDAAATWPAALQDALWAEYESGQMSEAERERYELAGLRDLKLSVRPRVRRGATIAVKHEWSTVRIGPSRPQSGAGLDGRIRTPSPMVFRDGVNLSDPAMQQSYGESSGMLDPTSRSTYGTAAGAINELGPHEIRINVTGWFKPQSDTLPFSPPRQITLAAKFDVVEGDPILPVGPTPEALDPGVSISALWVRLEVGRSSVPRPPTPGPPALNVGVALRWHKALGPLSHKLRLAPSRNITGVDLPTVDAGGIGSESPSEGMEANGNVTDPLWRKTMARLAGPTARGFDSRNDTPSPDLTVDVILEPDPARAAKTSEIDAYLNARFVFRNVPVFIYLGNGSRRESADQFPTRVTGEIQWLSEPASTPAPTPAPTPQPAPVTSSSPAQKP